MKKEQKKKLKKYLAILHTQSNVPNGMSQKKGLSSRQNLDQLATHLGHIAWMMIVAKKEQNG